MSTVALEILCLEDDHADVTRVREQFGGLEANFKMVRTTEDLRQALHESDPDLIIANGACKTCDSRAALALTREMRPKVPFVFTQDLPQLVPVMQRVVRDWQVRDHSEGARALAANHNELVEAAGDAIILCDAAGAILGWNLGAERLYGWTKAEALGENVDALLKTKGTADAADTLSRDGKAQVEIWQERRDGTPLLVASGGTQNTSESHRLLINRDMTAAWRAQETLRESEERHRTFVADDFTGNFTMASSGKIRACNPAFARIFGFKTIEEAQAGNFTDLFPSRKDGAEFMAQLQSGKVAEFDELHLRQVSGGAVYVIARFVGTFDAAGELKELQGYIFNDTKRKRLEQQIIQAQKMEGLGTLAGGIAHDFNNILAIILGYTSQLGGPRVSPEQIPISVRVITEAVERGAALVQQLLTSARQTEARFSSVDLNELVQELERMLQATFSKMIRFELGLKPGLPLITADRSQMHQVLLNLCINARDAMPNGGILRMATHVVAGAKVREFFPGADANYYVCMEVHDTGHGISREVKAHIFEPFFTTKERGKGTGLGLSVVYGVIDNHRGFVQAESEPGHGTSFMIYLPVENITAPAEDDASAGPNRRDEPQTILLVEDEEMLRELGVSILESEGYRVVQACDGEEAVALFNAHRDEIGLVVCDLGLPKLGGRDAFLKMKETEPNVRAIVASGYLEPTIRSEMLKAGVIDTIQKPYDFRELLAKIRSVIGVPKAKEEEPQLF